MFSNVQVFEKGGRVTAFFYCWIFCRTGGGGAPRRSRVWGDGALTPYPRYRDATQQHRFGAEGTGGEAALDGSPHGGAELGDRA